MLILGTFEICEHGFLCDPHTLFFPWLFMFLTPACLVRSIQLLPNLHLPPPISKNTKAERPAIQSMERKNEIAAKKAKLAELRRQREEREQRQKNISKGEAGTESASEV